MTELTDISYNIIRGKEVVSKIISDKILLEKYGVSWLSKCYEELELLIFCLSYRVENEISDDLTETLFEIMIKLIGKLDSIRVPISWGFYDTEPDPTDIEFQFTKNFNPGLLSFTLNFTELANLKYVAIKQPTSQPSKTKWFNTVLNSGNAIPDATFKSKSIQGAFEIIISRDPFIFQETIYNITFSA